jgi:Ca-activated chloride channel family protein
LRFSRIELLLRAGLGASPWKVWLTPVVRFLILLLLVVALARPQTGQSTRVRKASGVDITMVLDVSGSMQALDFELGGERVDRLTMLKSLASEFVSMRPSDRIGLVVFGSEAFSLSPLTLDHRMILGYLAELALGMGGDGTAIGDGLGLAVKRMADLPAKSRIVVLLTDGVNNAGGMDPRLAARIAAQKGLKVYTIGIGGEDPVPVAVPGFFGQQRLVNQKIPVDFELLQEISRLTGGQSFRAESTIELRGIYDRIDKLEKSEVSVKEFVRYQDRMDFFIILALLLVLFEVVLGCLTSTRRLV